MAVQTKYALLSDQNGVTAIPLDGHMLMAFQRGTILYDNPPTPQTDEVAIEVQVPSELLDTNTPQSGQNVLSLKAGLDVHFADQIQLPFRPVTL